MRIAGVGPARCGSIRDVSTDAERRIEGPDRRLRARGGRRPTDRPGLTPLVVVADEAPGSRETCEMILAKLNFAVAPVESVERALQVMSTLRPEVVVAKVRDASRLHDQKDVPVIEVTEALSDPNRLVDEIRRVLRGRSAS
jgi:hypothetical protein